VLKKFSLHPVGVYSVALKCFLQKYVVSFMVIRSSLDDVVFKQFFCYCMRSLRCVQSNVTELN